MTVHFRAITPSPSTLDAEARTIEVIVSTFADADRPGFTERLDPKGADLSRLVGAPVLDAHRASSTRDQLGVVEAAEIRPEGLWVRIRFRSNDAAQAVLTDIGDGTLRGLSIGYTVAEWKNSRDGDRRIRTATRWTPLEVSIVPVPADPGAHFRHEGNNMTKSNNGYAGIVPNGDGTCHAGWFGAQPPTPGTAEFDQFVELSQRAAEGAINRQAENHEIRQIAEENGLGRQWADKMIDECRTAADARSIASEAMQARSRDTTVRTTRAIVTHDNNDPAVIAERAGEALYARANPSHQLSEPARAFAGMTTRDLGLDCLRRAGLSTTGLSTDTIIQRALHSTSDFPLILGDTVGRELRRAYQAAPTGARQLARQTSIRDFRPKRSIQFGDGPALEEVGELGEFRYGTMAESQETYSLATFGKVFGISRQALVNDDLSAFSQIPAKLGAAAMAFENAQLVAKIEANPNMSDGVAVFAAGHGNLAGSGAAPSETTLGAARLAMRKQTGLSGELIDVTPRFLLVPPALETTAEKLLSTVQATKTGDVNPFANLTLVVEPRLTSASIWYLVADPAAIDGLEYAYLEGAPGPQIETKVGFEVDAVQMKVRLDFGSGWIDHRGWYRNG